MRELKTAKPQHGGKRPGAGQPKKAPTKVISVRVLVEDYEILKAKINDVVKNHNAPPKDFLPIKFEVNKDGDVIKGITITHNDGTSYNSMPCTPNF